MTARLVAAALVVLAFGACSDEGVPSPATTKLEDGTTVWKIQKEPPCPDNASCSIGVYVNRWYYTVECDAPALDEAMLGAVFATSDHLYVDEARTIEGESPETLALHLRGEDGDPCPDEHWISSTGSFDDHGLDDPPDNPEQRPPVP